jgi:hypothetical protein
VIVPVLRPSSDTATIDLPPRRAILGGTTDVLVIGGGPAGMGAALGAAWAGADVVLVERHGFLGGNATAALVMPLMSFHTQRGTPNDVDNTRLLPTDHGPGEPVVAGALATFLERLIGADGAIPPSSGTGFTVPFDPETYKVVAQEVVEEAGVRLLYHSFASGILGEPCRPEGVVFETKSGPVVIRAGTIVDCTGDGDVAAVAGARFDVGRDGDHRVQPMTLMFRIGGFDQEKFAGYVRAHPDQWRGVHGLWDLIAKATADGELDLPREDILFFATPHKGEIAVNSTRVSGVLGTSVFDLTEAERLGKVQMGQIAKFLRRYVPGFEDSYVIQSGVTVGVRETRRIVGDYQMTAEDVLEARKFDDGIARGSYPIDIHNPAGKGTILKRLPPGEYYEIPLRCLMPKDVERLLVGGRCISGNHEAHSSYRVTPTAMATGQAAGVCAALAARLGVSARQVPAADVLTELRRQGASLRE